jgi:hypothetical protein
MRVANLVEPPRRLARPAVALRVLAGGLRRPAARRLTPGPGPRARPGG